MGIRPRFLSGSVLLLSSFAAGQQVAPKPLITQTVDESKLVTLKESTHPLARPQLDVGTAPPDMPLKRMLLVLKRNPEQEIAMRKLLDDQQDKLSPTYHKWLTPDEVGRRFGASDQDLQIVTGWLQSHGFEIERVTHGRMLVEFSGTESQLEDALHTQIHKYLVNGEEHWANASDPLIPAALAPAIAGAWSLHDFRKQPNLRISPKLWKTKYLPGKRPDTTLTGSNGQVVHALAPADYATIYNINPLYLNSEYGQGEHIAVVARSNLFDNGQDIFNFESVFDPLCCGGVQIILDGPDPGDLGGGEEVEATLDATWSSAIAPAATVDFVVSASTSTTDGVDLSELYIIDNNLAPVMTESFGSCEAFATQAEALGISMLAEQAAAQGITYMISSGDSGAAGCDDPNKAPATHGLSVNVLASPQFTIAVGGTEFNEGSNPAKFWNSTNGSGLVSAISYIPENVWNESCASCQSPSLFSSGGGHSALFQKPTWQSGVSGIPSDTARDLPDLSLTAALHDGYLLCLEGSCIPDAQGFISLFLIGGTSASAPSFAGIMGLVDQQHGPQGQANYVLYRLAAAEAASLAQCNASSVTTLPASTCVFNDVTGGNNSVPGQTGFSAGTGYDLATGLGSVNVNNLVNQWNTISFRATTATLAPGTITGTHGLPASLTVSVAPNNGTGTPTGDVSLQTSSISAPGFVGPFPPVTAGFLSLNNGSISTSVSNLPGGQYTLTAQYAGDPTFAPSPPSAAINVNIAPENSDTALTLMTAEASGNLIPFSGGAFGGFVYLRADISPQSGQGQPTGSVSFVDNGNSIGTLNLNSQGNTATPDGYFGLSAGPHSLIAQYSGDNSFNASSSPPASFSIAKASTVTTLTPLSGAIQGSSVTLTASISSSAFAGAPISGCGDLACESLNNSFSNDFPSGTVTFFAGSTQLGITPMNVGQLASKGVTEQFSLSTTLPVGQDSITAQYSGDSNYLASSSAPMMVTIDADFTFAAASPTVTISRPGGSVSNTLTITGQSGYNGTVSFSNASCAGLPPLAQCSFSPASISGSGDTTITITTTAGTALSRGASWTGMGLVSAGVLLLNVPMRKFRLRSALWPLLMACAITASGCGGSSSSGGAVGSPGTPAGNYSVTVTATTTDGVVSHNTTFTLAVQ
jgi:hypothetical protein